MPQRFKLLLMILLAHLALACGGDDDDDFGADRDPNLGFPDIAGDWEGEFLDMEPFHCADAFPEVEGALDFLMPITQEGDQLYPTQRLSPGDRLEMWRATVVSDTGWGGVVFADGTFTAQTETVLELDVGGRQTNSITLNGTFVTDDRLVGEVRNRVTVPGDVTCDYFGNARAEKK